MATGDLADKVAGVVGGVGGRSVRMQNQMLDAEAISDAVPRGQHPMDHTPSIEKHDRGDAGRHPTNQD